MVNDLGLTPQSTKISPLSGLKKMSDYLGMRSILITEKNYNSPLSRCAGACESILISNGAKLLYVKEQAGHSSIKMTIDVYSKWLPNDDNLEINKLDI
ncbi:MAG: hypothetical protein OMM_10816 [Candidatus Magnetoglobus multicellularis str. Araruama]|uniref:Tyr recombinase domain-containing protein n=1 Tax=Candidatus Magnetoglobus multicellularis str. Araruama TaxID=890399 RepID=A0A1V1P007_9BACT|nr:MAG: hypothetical protein OMM_10816 [Candidatus Magnetoglobus multicellularis str. Araruama]